MHIQAVTIAVITVIVGVPAQFLADTEAVHIPMVILMVVVHHHIIMLVVLQVDRHTDIQAGADTQALIVMMVADDMELHPLAQQQQVQIHRLQKVMNIGQQVSWLVHFLNIV